MARTIIFGGTFDPPHSEHVSICKYAMQALCAERLVIVPTYYPPHKDAGHLEYEDRRELISLAFDGFDFVIDDIERERGGDNYSYLVLPLLKEKYGDIIYLIGGDSFEHFESWKNPADVVGVCPIAVAPREGYDSSLAKLNELNAKYGGAFTMLDCIGANVSSSMTKASLLLGEQPSGIADKVMQKIREKHLFEEYSDKVRQLRGYQTDELFNHSKAVVKRAVEFNSSHNLRQDFEKVFLAALLHDNAKQRPSLDGLDVPADCIGSPVLHQFLGAEKARRDFGIDDEEILSAIRYHTTAKPDMTTFEKLIYTADSLSDDRDYEPIPRLREIAVKDFEKGFLATLAFTYEKLAAKSSGVYPLTLEAYKYYIK